MIHELSYTTNAGCPNGWDSTLNQCKPSDDDCLARNNDPGFSKAGPISRAFTSRCISGCKFELKGNGPTVCTDGICTGNYAWTGVCPATSPPPPAPPTEVTKNDPQECVSYGSGQKFCQKTNGEQCYTSSNGKQTCWTAGETGEKNSDNVKQKRDPGPTEIPPNLTLPNGDTLTKNGDSKTQTTTITNPGSTPRTVTTTTTNYVTTNGTNSGPTNDGEKDDGSESGDDDKEQPGKVTGGGNCEEANKPMVEGDPLLANIVLQTWATRCAVESGNAVTSTGNIESCASDFTVTGPPKSPEVLKLKALRAQICPGEGDGPIQDSDFLGDGSGEAPASSVIHEFDAGGGSGWDMTGFGFGRSCPALPVVTVYGRTYDLGGDGRNAAACGIANILGWFVLLGAGLWCLRTVTEA
ncbi:hypothetical protein J2X06_002942 [Lysobacter niastensis]|uniref:Uncharacterized protein n=1 Tax=Lysobacter niastensis TaxID=380629 RepID=A0ABU1WDW2_9GAMM|nr:hypothetical protein [Lysobacter niastensis]MDR7135724.1 hypothetical protein [Lysobacter niastensis]